MNYLPQSETSFSVEELRDASPLTLSFVGDSVHTLYVRSKKFPEGRYKSSVMHSLSSKEVCAENQADLAAKMEPLLNETERYVFQKARSAKSHAAPAHATTYQYNFATAFEAVVGFLYLSGQNERLEQLMDQVYGVKL